MDFKNIQNYQDYKDWVAFFESLDQENLQRAAAACKDINKKIQKEKNISTFLFNTNLYTNQTYKNTLETYLFKNEKTYYYKIISGFSNNPLRVSCLIFPEYPSYVFYENQSEDIGSGQWELESFYIDNILLRKFTIDNKYEKISNEEWEEAFNKHVEYLKKLEAKYEEN